MRETSQDKPANRALARLKIMLASDEHRVSVQTTAGVLLAFGATLFMGRENMSWGVFSALFVVQASVGGTVSMALERIAGAVLGAAVGVAAVLLPVEGLLGTLISLLLGVSIMSLLTARWPKLGYGLVTVTIIIVAPDFYVVEGALEKIAAIGIGSVCGMIAALAVFPVSARRRAEYHLSQALLACGRLIDEYIQRLFEEEVKEGDADADISVALTRARDMSRQAQAERTPMSRPDGSHFELLSEVERFRYTLTLIDRFSTGALPRGLRDGTRDVMYELGAAVNQQMEQLAEAVINRAPCEPVAEVTTCFERLCSDVDRALAHNGMGQADHERLIAIKEAYAAMLQNLKRLCDRFGEQYGGTKT